MKPGAAAPPPADSLQLEQKVAVIYSCRTDGARRAEKRPALALFSLIAPQLKEEFELEKADVCYRFSLPIHLLCVFRERRVERLGPVQHHLRTWISKTDAVLRLRLHGNRITHM